MKRKLIVEEWLSLDGYVSDKTGNLDFFRKNVLDPQTTAYRMNVLNGVDTILFGRNTYTQFSALWPERPTENNPLAEKINTVNKVVFSNSLQKAPWGKWQEASVQSGDLVKAITEVKSLPGKNIITWGSATLVQAMIEHTLVDELHLHICPVLLGGGKRLFTNETGQHGLSLLETKPFEDGVVCLKYGKAK